MKLRVTLDVEYNILVPSKTLERDIACWLDEKIAAEVGRGLLIDDFGEVEVKSWELRVERKP